MEFSKDNSILELLPSNVNISDTSNSIILSSNGKIKIEKTEFAYNNWNSYINAVNQNTYTGTTGSIDLEITGGNISLGNPNNPLFSGRYKHPSVEYGADNNLEDYITSKFIGTQKLLTENENNAIKRYSGIEIKTDYYNNNSTSYWDENVNILTTKHASTLDSIFNSAGNISCSFSCKDQIDLCNNERFGSLVINPPNPRLIKTYADSQAFSQELFNDYITVENMKVSQNYIPSNSFEINNGNISITSYFNSTNSGNANSYNSSEFAKSKTLNKSTITGLNQIIYDTNGHGLYNFKWGSGIGSFFNYGRGYYEFPEEQLNTWSGNGNNEIGTSLYNYNNNMNQNEKQTYRRKLLNNVIMSGMIIENHFDKNMRFSDDQQYSTFVNGDYSLFPGIENPNLYGTDIENKQPPNESIHFVTYNNKEILRDNVTNPQVPVNRIYNKVWQGERKYNGQNGTLSSNPVPNSEQKTYGGEIRMTITSEGTVGIGTVNKVIPFEVAQSNNLFLTNVGSGHYFALKSEITEQGGNISESSSTPFTGYYGAGNVVINAKFNGTILATGLLVNSDRRIKCDIEEVPDKLALNQIKKLETKYYNYKDPIRKRKEKVIGFIAQETKEVIPNAVNIIDEFIPDELRIVDVSFEFVNNKWKFSIDDINFEDNHTGKCRFIMTNYMNIKTQDICVESDKKTFYIDNNYENVFLWGKQVNDFHTIDKNMIFALHHSGIQELSKENDIKEEKICKLEEENKILKEKIKIIEEKLGL